MGGEDAADGPPDLLSASVFRGRSVSVARREPDRSHGPGPAGSGRGLGVQHLLAVFALLTFGACSDAGPVSGPGTLTATLVSPNGPEGAALISLLGEGVGTVSPAGDTEAYAFGSGTTTHVVLINQVGGVLSFRVAVADTLERPEWVVQEVAGTDDALRSVIAGYELELRP